MKKVLSAKQKLYIKQIFFTTLSPLFSMLYAYLEVSITGKDLSQFAVGLILFTSLFCPLIALLFAISLLKESRHIASISVFILSLISLSGPLAVIYTIMKVLESFTGPP